MIQSVSWSVFSWPVIYSLKLTSYVHNLHEVSRTTTILHVINHYRNFIYHETKNIMAITIEHNPARDVTIRHDSSFSMMWRGDTQSCMTRVICRTPVLQTPGIKTDACHVNEQNARVSVVKAIHPGALVGSCNSHTFNVFLPSVWRFNRFYYNMFNWTHARCVVRGQYASDRTKPGLSQSCGGLSRICCCNWSNTRNDRASRSPQHIPQDGCQDGGVCASACQSCQCREFQL